MVHPRPVHADVAVQFAIRARTRELDGPFVVAQEGGFDERCLDGGLQAGRGQRDPATLAAPEDDDPLGVHGVVGARRIDRQDGIGEDASVEVGLCP